MKKHFLALFFVIISFNSLLGQDNWLIRLSHYISSFFNSKKEVRSALPLINAISNYDTGDMKEFGSNLKMSIQLWKYCDQLHKSDLEGKKLSDKDRALLIFARTMAKHEAEWKEWHTEVEWIWENIDGKQSQKEIGRQYFEKVYKDKNDQQCKIRNDLNSPHYESCIMIKDDSVARENLLENEAYHDELQFLRTQLHKMELYWGMREKLGDKEEEKKAEIDYQKTYSVLEDEIELFKKPENRPAFLKSFAKKIKSKNVEFIQTMRNEYKKNNSENLC